MKICYRKYADIWILVDSYCSQDVCNFCFQKISPEGNYMTCEGCGVVAHAVCPEPVGRAPGKISGTTCYLCSESNL